MLDALICNDVNMGDVTTVYYGFLSSGRARHTLVVFVVIMKPDIENIV